MRQHLDHGRSDRRQQPRRGYSLPFVLLILILLSISLATLLFVLLSGARSTESMLGRRRLFYACDGISRITAVAAQEYFAQTANPTSAELRAFVCAKGGDCPEGGDLLPTFMSQTPGHRVTQFDLSQVNPTGDDDDDGRVIAPLDSGPFKGMIAMQDRVDMKVVAEKLSSGWKCDVTQELSLAKIAMFQFFIFSDLPYTDWSPGPPMAGLGRTHANGDICFWGGDGPLYVERVTASGKIENDPDKCFRGSSESNTDAACVMVDDNAVLPTTLSATCTAGWRKFSDRPDNDADWRIVANRAPSGSTPGFNGHLQDRAHNVPRLKLPVFGTTDTQFGIDARVSTAMTNADTSRLLVDPVRAGEPNTLSSQRFAKKADLRIVDGVWYLRREDDSDAWPGDPIWSDHPGKSTTPATSIEGIVPTSKAVGQLTLASAWGGDRPQRYSYYTFNDVGALTRTAPLKRAVISYGTLFKEAGAPTIWHPGYRCADGSVKSALTTTTSCALPAGPVVASVEARLLHGTRSGLRNGMAQKAFPSELNRSNHLPVNFDVAAFQMALMDSDTGELGSYFPGTALGTGRRFNGIVWIGSTWSGQMNSTPVAPPAHGAINDSTQVAAPAGQQQALPYPLCGDPGSVSSGQLAGEVIGVTGFTVPSCAKYTDATGTLRNARPTSLRIFNARNINTEAVADRPDLGADTWPAGQLPLKNGPGKNGLTIATNITTYLMGDTNLSSPAELPAAGVEQHWVPFLVAGDAVHLLSNAWDDTRSRWDVKYAHPGTSQVPKRVADPTTYHFEMLSGWAVSADENDKYGGGLHNFPRFQENWSTKKALIRGSLVAGWYPVMTRWVWTCCDDIDYDAPNRDWGFDEHLNNILNQPPGAPLYDVQATRRWKR